MIRSWTSTDAESEIAVGITPGTGDVIIGSCSRCQNNKMGIEQQEFLDRWRSLVCYRDTCEIPEKILKGAWTRDKLIFREAVLEASGCVSNRERIEAARHGLMDAMHSDDYRAVDLIASESVDALQTQFTSGEGVYVEPSYSDVDLDFVRNQDYCPSVSRDPSSSDDRYQSDYGTSESCGFRAWLLEDDCGTSFICQIRPN